jgi:hypothetical protein
MKKNVVILAILALAAFPVLAGEWHTGQNNLCADCHTMHNSMAHAWNGTSTVTVGTPAADGNWVGVAGPAGNYLLKAEDPNKLCLACHDNQTFAPDVLGDNSGGGAANRSAGYLNDGTNGHTGHSLDGAVDVVAPGGTFKTGEHGLECINCHTQHGVAGVYRNLAPRGTTVPTYALAGRQPLDMTGVPTDLSGAAAGEVDIFINAPGYKPNENNFGAFYETANISYLKRTTLSLGSENRSGSQCANCHNAFHGDVGTMGGEQALNSDGTVKAGAFEKFYRHPVAGVIIGKVGGGHSDPVANRYAAAASVSRVKVYADDQATFADATPGCVSCHKAHGNGQPFGLIFANRTVAGMTEEGTMAANPAPSGAETAIGQRALCGQCHKQGN